MPKTDRIVIVAEIQRETDASTLMDTIGFLMRQLADRALGAQIITMSVIDIEAEARHSVDPVE